MKRKETEIYLWAKEVFKTNKLASVPTLKGIISANQKDLEALMSVRVVAKRLDSIDQYNIETKNFITNITTIQWLDLHLTQYNKQTKTHQLYSPYSNPGYNVFVNLLMGYYEIFKKRPPVNFSNIDINSRNESGNRFDNPMKNFVDNIRWEWNVFGYLNYRDLIKEDKEWITRLVSQNEENWNHDREWFGIQWDNVVMKMTGYQPRSSNVPTPKIVFEKDLIPLFLQAYLDVNLSTTWPDNAVNLKKIYEMIFYVMENEDVRKKVNEDDNYHEIRKNTPLTPEEKE